MMRAARMYGYKQPLILEEIDKPSIKPGEVLVKVEAAGMCRTDLQMVDGYFREYLDLPFPAIPGHEIAGSVEEMGADVPATTGLAVGDQVVVVGGWGDGTCRQCRLGNEQICGHGVWPGFSSFGGYSEYVPVPYKYLIRIDRKYNLKPEQLAPLTDAGLTPYRGIKKLRAAGVLGPDRVLAVFGVGGLGAYAVQYAKLLSSGATVVAFARNDEKLAIAKEHGADHVINMRGKSLADIRSELTKATGHREIDGAIDCVGAKETLQTGFGLLTTAGAYVSVGLVGSQIEIPLFPLVAREFTYHGSFWGNHSDLSEVVALAQQGKIKHAIKKVQFKDINENLELLRDGDVVGRAVVTFGAEADVPSQSRAAETSVAVYQGCTEVHL
ncbi:MAG TPA: NAD(P)-dependent alcohol dehydrogenase [Bryobacteraceae bacterium]|nr:NAD(P)-dependent alcohol dehydrogenase [Bryobacteraceae bacterium]